MQEVFGLTIDGLEWRQDPSKLLTSWKNNVLRDLQNRNAVCSVAWDYSSGCIAFASPNAIFVPGDSNQRAERGDMPVTRQHMMKNSSDSSLQFVAKMQREMMTATTNALTFSGTMRKRVMKANAEKLKDHFGGEMLDELTTHNFGLSAVGDGNAFVQRAFNSMLLSYPSRQCLFVIHPQTPGELITLETPHEQPVSHVHFSSAAHGSQLLSIDQSGLCCIWKMKSHAVNNWKWADSFWFGPVSVASWVPDYMFSPPSSFQVFDSFDIKFAAVPLGNGPSAVARPPVPCFIVVSSDGAGHIVWRKSFTKRWCRTSAVIHECPIDHSTLVFLRHMKRAQIAISSAGTRNTIHIYNVRYDIGGAPSSKAEIVFRLDSRICLLRDTVNMRITHLRFQTGSERESQSMCVSMDDKDPLSNRTQYMGFFVVLTAGTHSIVQRWSKTITESRPEGCGDNSWKCEASFSSKGTCNPPSECGDVIVTFECPNNNTVFIGYASGRIDLRHMDTLDLIKAEQLVPLPYHKFVQSKLDRNKRFRMEGESMKENGAVDDRHDDNCQENILDIRSFPVCCAPSPSGNSFACLDSDCRLHVFLQDSKDAFKEVDSSLLAKKMAVALEMCLVKGQSDWDLLLGFRDACIQLHANFTLSLIPALIQDYQELNGSYKQFCQPRFRSLLSHLLRMVAGHEIPHFDIEAHMNILFILDCCRLLAVDPASLSANPPTNTEQAFANSSSRSPEISIHPSLTPMAKWILKFVCLVLMSVKQFKNMDELPGSFTTTMDLLCFFLYNRSQAPCTFPLLSVSFNVDCLVALQHMILVAQCIIQSESTETTTTVDAFPMTDMKSFYTILQQLHQATTEVLKNCGFEYSLKFLQEMKARVSIIDMSCASLCKTSTEMSTMREFLDQGTTVYTSFLDQNRVPKEKPSKAKAEHDKRRSIFQYTNMPLQSSIQQTRSGCMIDCLTKETIAFDTRPLRQCLGCHRVTAVDMNRLSTWDPAISLDAKQEAFSFLHKWSISCPFCNCRWKYLE